MTQTDIAMLPHKVGDFVVYKSLGIYKINDIRTEKFSGLDPRVYYVMNAASDKSSVAYVPVDLKDIDTHLRHILSSDEIDAAISDSRGEELEWIENPKDRAAAYDLLLSGGKSADLLRLFKVLTLKRREYAESHKKLYAGDIRILSAVEKIITEEFSFVLGIEKSEVIPYIISKIEATA